MPTPRKGEGKSDFVSRCMSSEEAKSDFPDTDQRLAFCHSVYEKADMEKEELDFRTEVIKVDENLGLVMGYAIVCKKDGKPYFDVQGDHIPEEAMLKAALDFMVNSRMAKDMHKGDEAGTVAFAFPMTTDIAKAFGIETKQTGLMIAMRPDKAMLKKFKDGKLTGFSIGGLRIKDEEVKEDE